MKPNKVTMSRAMIEDLPEVFRMLAYIPAMKMPERYDHWVADWRAKRLPEILVARIDGKPVGVAIYEVMRSFRGGVEGWAWLSCLAVDENHRRSGVATAIINRVKRRVRKMGAVDLVWEVYNENTTARAFYDKIGAIELEPEREGFTKLVVCAGIS
jgi:GNAT superfamily N-acetyltransferase